MSVTVFAVSTYMLVNQVKFFQPAQQENILTWMNSNDTKQFCLWTAIPDGNCGKGSNYTFHHDNDKNCDPEKHLVCIPMSKKCDGIIDMFSNGNGSYRFFISQTDKNNLQGRWIRGAPDETYCGDSRFLGFYIFNICAGAIGILLSTLLCYRTLGSVRVLVRLFC